MAYTKKTWVKGSTPLSAENFNHMEQGIADAHSSIAQLNSDKCAYALLYRHTNIVISGELDGIVFDDASTSNNDIFSLTNNSITIKSTGVYIIVFNLHLHSQSGNQGFYRAKLLVNDSVVAANQQMSTGQVFTDPSCTELLTLNKGDVVKFGFFLTESANITSAKGSVIKIA